MKTMIKNGIIVTMNSRMDVYPDGYLIMEDDRISEVGPMTGYDAYRDRQGMMVIDAGHAIVMPGMVNTHCHMGMIPFRGLTAQALLPVGGIIYDGPVEELARDLAGVRRAMRRLGYENNNEIMSMSTLALPVSPQLKLTDYGLLDVRSQEQLPLIEDYMD